MSAEAEESGHDELAAPLESYDRVLKAVHWSTLLLIAAAYVAIWAIFCVYIFSVARRVVSLQNDIRRLKDGGK